MNTRVLLLLLSLYGGLAFAQDRAEIKEAFWGKDDPYKSAVKIPDKWKNESAVIIYKNENYDFHKFGTSVTYISSVRKRIKLLDQAAVTEFSEFSFKERFRSERGFAWRSGTNIVGVKVIKPDGTEREINIDEESVKTDEEKKVAIPNLEVGDIIDYYYHSTEPFKSKIEYGFDPEENTLGDVYPIMDMKLTFKTENDFFVNFNTYNGAPDLKEVSEPESKERRYELVAHDIEKNDFPRWFYPLVELPCYKFQVYFARSGKFEERADAFLPEKEDIIKKTVSQDDVFSFYDNKFRPYGDLGDIERFLKGKTFASDAEKVKAVYYFTRHYYYTRYVEAFVVKEANIMYPFDLYGSNPIFFNNETQFIDHFMAFLKDNKIEYDIIIATPRYNGSINDLLIQSNLEVLLKVNTSTPVYLGFFTPYSNADQIDYNLENSDAYALKVSKRKKVTDIERVKLPSSTYQENLSKEVLEASLTPDFSTIKVDRESTMTGHAKDYDQREKMYFFDYVGEDYAKYGTDPLMDHIKNKKRREEHTREFDALKKKLKDKQKEEFKSSLESEFEAKIESDSLEIINTGRFGAADPFVYKEHFTFKDELVKKAGPNYIVEIGRLIGSQVDIKKKESDRTNNIYSVYPRSYSEEIHFTVPDGYTVAGLDKLNKKVENSTGGFVSSATLEGNKLTIKAYKYYAHYYEPNSNWKAMTDFLDAAYQFTQEKILLKKN